MRSFRPAIGKGGREGRDLRRELVGEDRADEIGDVAREPLQDEPVRQGRRGLALKILDEPADSQPQNILTRRDNRRRRTAVAGT